MPLSNKRPKLNIPLSLLEKALEAVSFFAILGIVGALYLSWNEVPDRMPTHFGPSGQPDAWGGKGSLLFLPILLIALYILLTVISRFPHIYNYLVEITEQNARFQYQNARTMICWLKIEIVVLFGYIQWTMIQVGLGKTTGLGVGFLPLFLLVLFGTMGVYIFRMVKHR